MARRKVVGGAEAFKSVKIGGRRGKKQNLHAIGIDEKHYIPGTEHNPSIHHVFELPLKAYDKAGKPAREGMINRVLWVETYNGPVVVKIPRIDGFVHDPIYVDDRHMIDEKIAETVPAAKLLDVVWLKGVNYKGTDPKDNPYGIPIELHEPISIKNLKQEYLGEKEFHRALREAVNITLTLFKNGILYDGNKPENFCRDADTKQVKAVDKNASPLRSYLTFEGESHDKRKRERRIIGKNLAEFLVDLYRSNTIEPNERMLWNAIGGVKSEIADSGLKEKEIKRITENFEEQLAGLLRKKGMASLDGFVKKRHQ